MGLRIALATLSAALVAGGLLPKAADPRGVDSSPSQTQSGEAAASAAVEDESFALASEGGADSSFDADHPQTLQWYCCCSNNYCSCTTYPCAPGSYEVTCPCTAGLCRADPMP